MNLKQRIYRLLVNLERRISRLSSVIIVCLTAVFCLNPSAHAERFHVDGSTGSDGDSGLTWPLAFLTVQKALAAAAAEPDPPHEIWVAQGTYYPDEGPGQTADDRESTFNLVNTVKMYGGFEGDELDLEERDVFAFETILSGDIDQNDGPGEFEDNDNNSIHVVVADGVTSSTIIDGFTIRGGNANGVCPGCPHPGGTDIRGGGMPVLNASPTVYLCTFDGNEALNMGGGIGIINSSPVVFLCTFEGNLCGLGGGIAIDDGSPVIIRSTFTGNSAPGHGGGALNIEDASDPIVINSSFIGNDGREAGAVHIEGTGAGGTFVNCLFSANTSTEQGGAINPGGTGVLDFINCTFADNTTDSGSGGGAISTENLNGEVNLTNCILWGNLAGIPGIPSQIDDSPDVVSVTYSCFEGDLGEDWDDGFNINDDPLFFDPPDNYRLAAGSPCIGWGNNADVPCDEFDIDEDGEDCDSIPPQDTPDLDLGVRIVGGDVDMGAYEFCPPNSCPWDLDGGGFVGAGDLLLLLADWGNPYGAAELLALLADWGACPSQSFEPPSLEDELDDACLSPANWADFLDKMETGSSAQQQNYICWLTHYFEDCTRCLCIGASGCPGADPFDD